MKGDSGVSPGEEPWPAAALPRGVREEWEAGVLRYVASIKRSKKHKRAVQTGTFGTGMLQWAPGIDTTCLADSSKLHAGLHA